MIAQKVATSLAVEGDLSSNGLTSMAGGDNMGRSIAQMLVDSDITFDGSFEAGINIAALQEESEGEELLADYDVDFDREDADAPDSDGMTPEVAVSLVTQTLVPGDGTGDSGPQAVARDGFDMPLFGTVIEGALELKVCDGCDQFIMPDEERITTPAVEVIDSREGVTTVPARQFHTNGCYDRWSETMQAAADQGNVPETDAPVNEPRPTPTPSADVPDPADFGAVSMDAWMSAFGLETEDLERGKRKRTRKSRKKADSEQGALIPLH